MVLILAGQHDAFRVHNAVIPVFFNHVRIGIVQNHLAELHQGITTYTAA